MCYRVGIRIPNIQKPETFENQTFSCPIFEWLSVRKPDHLPTDLPSTIRKPDTSGFRIPLVVLVLLFRILEQKFILNFRLNVILSRQEDYDPKADDVIVCKSVEVIVKSWIRST